MHQNPHSFNDFYTLLKLRKVPFFIVFFLAVLVSYGVLFAIDFIPEPIDEVKNAQEAVVSEEEQDIEEVEKVETRVVAPKDVSELPVKIIFDSLGTEVTVANPTSRNLEVLDTALLKGVVRLTLQTLKM
jgi:hypothetical protein